MRIRNGFEEFFCLRSNLSNDNIISALRPGLETGMGFSGLVWKRVCKITFFDLKSGQELQNRAADPHQKFQEYPPGVWADVYVQKEDQCPKRKWISKLITCFLLSFVQKLLFPVMYWSRPVKFRLNTIFNVKCDFRKFWIACIRAPACILYRCRNVLMSILNRDGLNKPYFSVY